MSQSPHVSPFDAIRKVDEHGNEYWSDRELYKILGYSEWRNFRNTVIIGSEMIDESACKYLGNTLYFSYHRQKGGVRGGCTKDTMKLPRHCTPMI